MTPRATVAWIAAGALVVLAVYLFLQPLEQARNDLPPELAASSVEAEEISLPAEGGVANLELFHEELQGLPADAEVEVRLRQLDRTLARSSADGPGLKVRVPRRDLEEAITATQPRPRPPAEEPGEDEPEPDESPPGVVDLELWLEGKRLASRTVAVASWNSQGPVSPDVAWRLDAADAAYRPERFFEVPVRAVAQVERGGELVPYRLEEPARLLIRDLEGSLEPREIELPAGRLMSDPVLVPLRPKDRYRLVAEPVGVPGTPSNPLEITWQSHGPELALEVLPAVQDRFASRADPARLQVFLSLSGSRVRPPEGAGLTSNPPRGVVLDPSPPELDEDGVWTTAAYADASLPAARIQFADLDFGLETAAEVDFAYPTRQLLFAILAGALGVVVARRLKLLELGRVPAALEVLTAMVAAGLLYAALVAGWVPPLPGILATLPAIAIGILGGYLGEAVFQVLAKRVLPTAGAANGGAVQ